MVRLIMPALLAALLAAPVSARAQTIPVPSDTRASYTVLQLTPRPDGLVELLNQRVGPSGTSFARREVDCRNNQFRFLGDGETLEQAQRPLKVPQVSQRLIKDTVQWDVFRFVCDGGAPR